MGRNLSPGFFGFRFGEDLAVYVVIIHQCYASLSAPFSMSEIGARDSDTDVEDDTWFKLC
jgi:hypothetical protein